VGIESTRQRTVPLEAGIGPANPPCPACGEPLFGWATAPGGAPVRRCEACGLGVVGDPGGEDEALAALEALRVGGGDDPRYRIANRASLQASVGASGWAQIEPGSRFLFTPEAVRRLASARDQELVGVRWLPGASVAAMWATLLNSFTWGRNVAAGALGQATPTSASRRWQRTMDAVISVLATPIVLVAALLLESGAAAAGRGGALELTLRLQ
jgi:hypothetical protein